MTLLLCQCSSVKECKTSTYTHYNARVGAVFCRDNGSLVVHRQYVEKIVSIYKLCRLQA